eukprot:g2116.t1
MFRSFTAIGSRLRQTSVLGHQILTFRNFSSTPEQDVVVIGGGPGGYVAAIKAGQLGMKVTCVEGRGTLGGTCLNVGCIPSKALLHSSHLYAEANHHFSRHGVMLNGGVSIDVNQMMKQKTEAVTGLTKGIEMLLKKNKVNYSRGWGSLKDANTVEVTHDDGSQSSIPAKNIIIATGSEVTPLPGIPIDEERIVSSTGALELKEVPKSMVVIGGGYIGLEMGSVWGRLGSQITVVEFLDRIVPTMDGEVRRAFQRALTKQGMKFKLNTKVTKAEVVDKEVKITLEPADGGASEEMTTDILLVSAGRRPYTKGLKLDNVGIELDKSGRIPVDDHFRTSVNNVYAIGDCIHGPMLAHKAEEDGIAAVEIINGQAGHVNYETVPGIVYTWPEVASVGKTEEQLKEQKIEYKVGKFSFMANSRARTVEDTEGLAKILADKNTDKLLGAHLMGPNAGELIGECVMALEYGASSEDIARVCHGHPTLSEAVKEAAMATSFGKPIHA